MILKMAIRNIFRNKRRTFLAALAISFGLTALIFVDALQMGMVENMVKSATSTYMGEAQIHKDGFTKTMEVEKTIVNGEKYLEKLKKESVIDGIAPRVKSIGMITSPANVHSVLLTGIDPEQEKTVSKINKAVVEGEYMKVDDERALIIGYKVAEILEVGLGDKVVVTVAQAETGEMAQEMFRVSGITRFGIREFDRNFGFIPLKKAQKMLGLEGKLHEIAVTFKNLKMATDPKVRIWDSYNLEGNKFQNWKDLMPEMNAMLEMMGSSMFIIAFILFLLVAGVIINTLFMSLFERMFEFGVIKAIGMKRFKTAMLIVLEAGALAVMAAVIGSILSIAVTGLTAYIGLDFTGTEFVSVGITELIYPKATIQQYTVFPLALIGFTMLVGCYPAIHAARIQPAEAMKKGSK